MNAVKPRAVAIALALSATFTAEAATPSPASADAEICTMTGILAANMASESKTRYIEPQNTDSYKNFMMAGMRSGSPDMLAMPKVVAQSVRLLLPVLPVEHIGPFVSIFCMRGGSPNSMMLLAPRMVKSCGKVVEPGRAFDCYNAALDREVAALAPKPKRSTK